MILAIDIGNTNIVLGCMEHDRILVEARMATDLLKTSDQYCVELKNLLNLYEVDLQAIEGVIISSVVPPVLNSCRTAVRKLTGKTPMIVGPGIRTGLNIQMENPAQIGSDLIVAAVAALSRFEPPLIIIDMGTATTITAIDKTGTYVGGCISPGPKISAEALSARTAQLPAISLESPKKAIGKNTIDAMRSGVIARTIVLDRLTKAWLASHPGAAVVNIACGLDTRCYRVTGYAHWYNLDLPETMAVREKLLPEGGAISQIAMSAMDDWGGEISEQNAPVLIVIEGLTMYLNAKDVQQIFAVISSRFSQATIFVETMNPMIVKRFKEKSIEGSHAKFTWGIKNGKALAELLPGFRFMEEHSLTEGMAVFAPIYKLLDKLPTVRNISNKIIVLEKEL